MRCVHRVVTHLTHLNCLTMLARTRSNSVVKNGDNNNYDDDYELFRFVFFNLIKMGNFMIWNNKPTAVLTFLIIMQ